jgi:dipeptidyl aminopeptidase/acylaminoacyl peptidase
MLLCGVALVATVVAAANHSEFYVPFWERGGKSVAKSNHLGALATAVAVLVEVGVLGLVQVRPAEATFPGKNGKIAFQSDRGGSYEIYTMNRNGNKIDKLTTNTTEDEDPAFSPNGKTIAFTSDRDGDSDIYKMTVRGRRLVRLTTDPATTFGADWGVR